MNEAVTRARAGILFSRLICALTTLLALLTTLPVCQVVRYSAAFALLWLLPAASWCGRLQGDSLARTVSGFGLALVSSGLTTLLLHLIPGPFPTGWARAVYALVAVAPLLLPRHHQLHAPLRRSIRWDLVIVLCVALLARLVNLGYSEFQGDEAVIMQRAADVLQGDDDELFLHQKGPAEILLPMSVWALSGTLSEWQARLPFVLAGVLAVLAVTALGTAWFGRAAGVAAGLLVAANGFLVAFGRIAQYQNLVVAMGTLTLLWATGYGRRREAGALILSAVFLAFGLLAHYDAVLVAPAAAALIVTCLGDTRSGPGTVRQVLVDLAIAAGVGAVVMGIFYVPFVTNPMFARTFQYLLGGRVGSGLLHNSLVSVWRMSTFYNALPYVVGLGLLVVSAALLRRGTPAAWLYFAAPFAFYCFVVADPRTHVYTFYSGAALLAGAALVRLAYSVPVIGWLRTALGGALGLWYVLCAGYIGLAFVDHRVEYKRAWPESRHPLYPVPFADDELPPYGHFGFPYRAGWKAVERLFEQGSVSGTYASNEEPEITTWYIRSADRTMCGRPDVYVVAEHVQDEIAINWGELDGDYSLAAVVMVNGAPKIRVYTQEPGLGSVLRLDGRGGVGQYDSSTTPAVHRSTLASGAHAVRADFGDVGRLLGYDVAPTRTRRDEDVTVTLHWQALSSPERNYQVLVHLVHEGDLVAQGDGAPACAFSPTSLWESGDYVRDEHLVTLAAEAPLGTYELYVGLYDLLTLERLPVEGGRDNTLLLHRLEVMP